MSFQSKPSSPMDGKFVKAAAVVTVALMIFLVVQMAYFNRNAAGPDIQPNPDSVEPDDMAPPEDPDAPWAPDGSDIGSDAEATSEEPDDATEETNDAILPVPDPQPLQGSGQSGWFDPDTEPVESPGPLLDIKAVITGPDQGNVGDLVKFSSIGSVAKSLSWRIVPPEGEAHTIIGVNGDLAFSYSKPGTYTILLIAVRDNEHDIALHTYVNGGQPLPDNDVDPVEPDVDPDGPVPDNDIPDHWDALSSLTKQAVLDNVPNSPGRVGVANKMADSMDAIASAIAAGVLTDTQSIREETRARNLEAIGPIAAVVWMDAAIWLGNKIAEYDAKGHLATVEDYGVAWGAIAKGLRSVPTE